MFVAALWQGEINQGNFGCDQIKEDIIMTCKVYSSVWISCATLLGSDLFLFQEIIVILARLYMGCFAVVKMLKLSEYLFYEGS